MKKVNLLAFIATMTLVFSSCSGDENLPTENLNVDLLKNYTLKRDINGAYSLDFDVNTNTKVDKVLNTSINENQYFLYPSDKQTDLNINQNLSIDQNQLKVSFIDTNADKKQHITVQDDNILFAKSNNDKLATYEIKATASGEYDLSFSVKNNVNVSFVYNDKIAVYEIHLENGKGGETNFSRTLEKVSGESLQIHFVNHQDNESAKTAAKESTIRKPVIIIDDGENG